MNRTAIILFLLSGAPLSAVQERMSILTSDGNVLRTVDGTETDVRIDPELDALLATPGARLTITHALREVMWLLRAQTRPDELSTCDEHIAHLVAIALHKAGVIRYASTLSPARLASYRTHDVVFGHVTEAAAVRLRHDGAR